MAVADRKLVQVPRVPEGAPSGPSRFGEFAFDLEKLELRSAGQILPASTLSVNLLGYLLSHRERVVSRDELVENVWQGVVVAEGALRQAIWELRQTLSDSGDEQQIIRTIRGRGYRFVAALNESEPSTAREPAPRASEPPRSATFYGRANELQRLAHLLHEATHAAGSAAAIVGAPGIGKTQLTSELARFARGQAVAYYEVSADPDGATPAFWPWLHLLACCLATLEEARRQELAQLFPRAFRLLSPASESASDGPSLLESPAHERFATLAELANLFVGALGERATLLVFEDLQWADEASLALLRHLLQSLPRTRSLLLVTSRAQKPRENRPLSRTLEAITRSARGTELLLANLSADEVTELLASHAGAEVPAELSAQIFTLSRGNPLLATELGLLLRDPASLVDGAALGADGFFAVIQRRLQQLPESALSALLAASILGPEFSLAELCALLDESSEHALACIDTCIEHGFLVDGLEAGFRFSHPVMREAAYASLSRPERCRLHRLAGDWLERSASATRGTRLNGLAHHYFHAAATGATDKAVRYSLRCAEVAYAATAYNESVLHYERAQSCLELDGQASAHDKLETALLRGEALRASGADTIRVNQHFLMLAERAEELGEAALFARAVLGYTGQRALRFTPTRFAASSNREETALIERALRAVGEEPSELRALLLCSLMGSLVYSDERVRRERAASEADQIARVLERPFVTVRVLATTVYCCATPDTADQRITLCDELLAVAARHGLRAQESDALITRALCHLGRGDVRRAHEDEIRARRLAASDNAPQVRARSELIDLMRAFWEGDLPRAKQLTQRALDVAPEDAVERALYMLRSSSLRLLETGLLSETVAQHELLLRTFPDAVGLHCSLASAYALLGDRSTALHHFDIIARDDFRALPVDLGWLGEMGILADVAMTLEDVDRSSLLYARLLPYGQVFDILFGESGPLGPVAYGLAGLAITMRDFAAARGWLDVAQELNQRLGATLLMHFGFLLEARLIGASRPSDLAQALSLTRKVEAFASARGLRWLVICAERQQDALIARTPTRVATHGTPRSS